MTERLPRPTIGSLVRSVETLLSLPDVLLRINALIDDPTTRIADLAGVILCDPALAARLLRLINSAYYGLPNRVESISHAINLIGLQTLRDLVLTSSAVSLFDGLPPEQVNMERFWLHSIACGAAVRLLARRKRLINADRLFVAGLLHSIGKLIFYSQCPAQYRKVLDYVERGQTDLLTAERWVFGFTYAELSAELLRAWRLPDHLRVAVAYHLRPTQAPEYRLEASIVHVAARIATDLQTDVAAKPAARNNPRNLAEFVRLLQIPPESLVTLPDEVRRSAMEIFGIVHPGAALCF
ncbi:MAG: HDOD domain-containing protein [Candidatus Contendobacter sp.]|nr:HDOD domain-containing protein [Candidatus Contendobacter sp.]